MRGNPQTVKLCPACGSGKIVNHMMDPDDGYRRCSNCNWTGGESDLITAPIPENPNCLKLNGDAAKNVLEQISRNLLILLAKYSGHPLGVAIVQAGLCGRLDKTNLARLIKAGCLGAHKAVLDEADKISAEYSKNRILS